MKQYLYGNWDSDIVGTTAEVTLALRCKFKPSLLLLLPWSVHPHQMSMLHMNF